MKRTYKNTDGKGNVTYVEYEIAEPIEEEASYTEEQLNGMTNTELESVCKELGISPNKSKANMIVLIMDKQRNEQI